MITIILMLFLPTGGIQNVSYQDVTNSIDKPKDPQINLYTPVDEVPLNIKEQITLSPMFTPDNALDIHAAWLTKANSTIFVQNQYIKQFDRSVSWAEDPNPIVRELVNAAGRGVQVRVQVREDSDSDDVTSYLNGITNIEVRWMGNSVSSTDGSYLSATHNKIIVIDDKVTLVSSINYGENAFLNNREAGMVIQSQTVAAYYMKFLNADWDDGEIPPTPAIQVDGVSDNSVSVDFQSPTNIPKTNFSGVYNVSAYVNPDNADELIFKYLNSAKSSIYVSMYTISRQEFVDTLVNLKKNNPGIDIQVLISRRRVGASENIDTIAAAKTLVDNLIPVYNSTSDLNFYHNKYWIIDGKHTFIYSGNWSPRSVTPKEADGQYSSGDPNRDMGIAVLDAPDIANFVKTEVWDKDVAVASAWELPVGITQTSFEQAEVVSGTVTLSGTVTGLDNVNVAYRFGSSSFTEVTLNNGAFSIDFDTTQIENGVTTFEIKADTGSQVFSDSVDVNVVNLPENTNWRVLITEVFADPSEVSDSDGEFIEITNSFPFDVLLEGWQVGDDKNLLIFNDGYTIAAYSSIIIARSKVGFDGAYSTTADFELSFSLTNTGDYVQFLNAKGEFVDVVAYGSAIAPDGSEVLESASSGNSLQRTPLHIDTNKASDFTEGLPTPKAAVPQVALDDNATNAGTEDSLGVPFIFPWFVLLLIPVLRRRR